MRDKEWLVKEVDRLRLENTLSNNPMMISNRDVIAKVSRLIDQLDESEKPVIPQFVVDWIEEAKARELTLYGAIHECPREADYWFVDGDSSNQETFARAWLDGYEVEKERKYYIAFDDEISLLYVTRVDIYGENGKCNYNSEFDKKHALKFTDKSKAEYLADFLGATVVEAAD